MTNWFTQTLGCFFLLLLTGCYLGDRVAPSQIVSLNFYVIARGDSVASIARKFHLSITDLESMNPGLNPTRLEVGQKVKVSEPTKE